MLFFIIPLMFFPFIVLAISIKLHKKFNIKKEYTLYYGIACVLGAFFSVFDNFEMWNIVLFLIIAALIHLLLLLIIWSIKYLIN